MSGLKSIKLNDRRETIMLIITSDRCPKCGRTGPIVHRGFEVVTESAYQEMYCPGKHCGARWTDVYDLDRRLDEEGEPLAVKLAYRSNTTEEGS